MERYETTFALRYAVRVLERHARYWSNLDNTIRFFSFLSATAAIASLSADHKTLSLIAGILFAILIALDAAFHQFMLSST